MTTHRWTNVECDVAYRQNNDSNSVAIFSILTMMPSLKSALEMWDIASIPSGDALRQLVGAYFPNWPFKDEFLLTLPEKHTAVIQKGNELLYLWREVTIVEMLLECQSTEFLQIGTLLDGGRLAIDVREQNYIRIGTFSVANCGKTNWKTLRESDYRGFPFSYPQYLLHVVATLEPQYLSN